MINKLEYFNKSFIRDMLLYSKIASWDISLMIILVLLDFIKTLIKVITKT